MDEKKKLDPSMIGVVGQMLGGLGTGLGAGLANKMNERTMLAAAALTGLLANSTHFTDAAADAVRLADAVLKRLEEVPDPRYPDTTQMPSIQKVVAP
jgi:hypothetical protein